MDDTKSGDEETLYSETTERFWFLRLVTRVREDGIYVRLEPLQRAYRRIQPDTIRKVGVTSYSATTYAGWHWGMRRTPSGNTVYRLRGNRGVEIQLENGERCFIGSQRPEAFESAIEGIAPTTG